jgi:photosystem II stability/assembly factor-like uncharacterized protein
MGAILDVATRKGLFTLERGPAGWRVSNVAHLGDNASMVLRDPRDGALYVALGHGHFGVKLHRSNDGGRTWTEITAPAYPPMPEGYEPGKHPFFGTPIEWRLELVWSLEQGGADRPGRLWCGTLPGGLFRSDDHGATWELVRSLWDDPRREGWFGGGYPQPGIHSICVDPRASDRVSIAISCGGVWHTGDAGATWKQHSGGMRAEYMPPEQAFEPNSQDPHRMVRCPAAPDAMWVQHHNGIFKSSDGGDQWSECKDVEPAAFGFAVAVHPKDPNTAWFVPGVKDEKRYPVDGRLVVTRTRDGGQSFEALGKGLPTEHAYHLVFRHGLDVDDSGERLAFGTTTGSLFVSEDSGDSWQRVTADLPPIHALRFA